MDKSKEINENAVIGEDVLESVDGGSRRGNLDRCFFEPIVPHRTVMRGGALWAECRKNCTALSGMCSCHRTPRCISRFHHLDNTSANTYFAHPYDQFNHNEPGKVVRT